jgi:long-chain acyl-CoA synthetase
VIERLIEVFERQREKPLLLSSKGVKSYGEFLQEAALLGEHFVKFSENPTVCVISKDTELYFKTFLACLLNGGRAVLIDAQKSIGEIKSELDMANPNCIFSDYLLVEDGSNIITPYDITGKNDYNYGLTKLKNADENTEALVTFTSGTTSVPKGVVHSAGNLMKSAMALGEMFEFGERDTFYHNFPPSYMAGILNQFILPMVFGAKIALGSRFNVQSAISFWETPIQFNSNILWCSPTMLKLILALDKNLKGKQFCIENKVTIIVATAPLQLSLRKEFELAYGVTLYESFGLTETLFNSSNCRQRQVFDGCSGYILQGVNPQLAADGELILSCDWMFLRYLEESHDTQKRKSFNTGDIAEIVDGKLYITGRKKDIIIKGGMNISPIRIEKELSLILKRVDFSILGLPDTVLGEKIALAYSGAPLPPNIKKEINQTITEQLGKDFVIDAFILVPAIPRNDNGKIDKNKLRLFCDGK